MKATDPEIDTLRHALDRYTARTGKTLRRPVAALIDMDGTLYDSMPWHARAWHRMVTELGIDATVDEFFQYEGMTGKATINLLFERAMHRPATDQEVETLYRRKTEYFRDNNHATVMPGATNMLHTLCTAGITPVLVTGSGQATLLDRLDTDFDHSFAHNMRITSRDVTHGKPHPEPYLKAMELANVSADRAIVIENAPLGARAGVASGAFTVAVNTGPIPRHILEQSGADLVLDSMTQWAAMLPTLLSILPN